MPELTRTNDETTPGWEPWQEPITCGICGAKAEMTDEMMDRWFPEVWLINPDGSEVEVSPVCGQHDCTYDEETGTWSVYPTTGNQLE